MKTKWFCAALLLVGCGDGEYDISPTPSPETVVTFADIEEEILVTSCNFSVCHENGAGGLTLVGDGAYDALVNAPSVVDGDRIMVVPGDVDKSYLIDKLKGTDGILGDPMPPPAGLDAERIALVEAWIAGGAQR